MEKFNEIRTRNELADFIEVPRKKLSYVLYVKKTENLYKSFDIPKKMAVIDKLMLLRMI